MKQFWTPSDDATLRECCANGESFGIIAIVLGRTRNACIGRAHRLGIASAKRPNVSRRAKYLAEQRAQTKRMVEAFAEALAQSGTIQSAADSIGVGRQRGDQLFAMIRSEIDGAQARAGFESWCV